MPQLKSSKFLILIALGLLTVGCPGKDFVEKRFEENKADCRVYGGSWLDGQGASGACSPEFGIAIIGIWVSECVESEANDHSSQITLTFSEETVQILESRFLSPICSELQSESLTEMKYFLTRRISDGQVALGQRIIHFNTDLPERFKSWKAVKIEDLNVLTILPHEKRFSRRT
jgi:hypothetical protein